MKPETNNRPLKENGTPVTDQSLATRLSEDAFYLITLATLLKKEFGENFMEPLLVPVKMPFHKRWS